MSCRGGSRLFLLMASVVALWSVTACKVFKSTCDEDDRSCLGGGLGRSGEGCIRTGDCAPGMKCSEGICEYAASTKNAGTCLASAECVSGSYCNSQLRCAPRVARPLAEGSACENSSNCAAGLVCDLDLGAAMNAGPFALLSDECRDNVSLYETSVDCALPKSCTKRGKRDFGDKCSSNTQCLPGLYCVQSPISDIEQTTCLGGVKLDTEPLSVPSWDGVECPDDEGTPVAYFELAAGSDDAHDFYRLPYPNDIRRGSDNIDLEAHPAPPVSIEPPVAARFLDDAAAHAGFSTNPVAYFRFSTEYSTGTLSLSSVRIVDITPDSPEYNTPASVAWGPPERDSNYICGHWLSLYRPVGAPLRPNTTYAAIVTRTLRTKDDDAYTRSEDFDTMLASAKPADANVAAAWQKYAPLRKWLGDKDAPFKADELLNAAVFTTGEPQAIVPKLRAAVDAEGGPALKALTVCKAGVTSPCAEDNGRGGCHAEQSEFTEIHGKITLPIYQTGEAPYEQPEAGGGLELTSQNRPRAVRHEDVCFAVSVPKRVAPAAGYPVVVYAYAVGGVFQEAMAAGGLASDLATGPGAAVLSIELPQHGARRGGSTREPADLFLNFQNPAAMRGNVLQGVADLWGAIELAKTGILSGPSGSPIKFNPARVALFAQGQGATHAALALSADDSVRSVVLAGLAGHIATTQLYRAKPASTAALLPLLLIDGDKDGKLPGGLVNPTLSLMQSALDDVDPINYADKLFRISQNSGRDVFLVFGKDDHFAPDSAQEAYAKAAKLQAVRPDLSGRFDDIEAPANRNQSIGTDRRTVALRQYDPKTDPVKAGEPEDGHFVVQGNKTARADVLRFLSDALAGNPPNIGAR